MELDREYELREEIGEGATSHVFMCVRRKDHVPFACKIIDKRKLPSDEQKRLLLKQLRREMEVLKGKPHMCTLWMCVCIDGSYFTHLCSRIGVYVCVCGVRLVTTEHHRIRRYGGDAA